MTDTPRFALPLLEAGQAQKEVTHNEAVARVDGLLHLAVEDRVTTVPPVFDGTPRSWIVAVAATGSWSGRDGQIALLDDAGWTFCAPPDGCIAFLKAEAVFAYRSGGAWHADAWRAHGLTIGGRTMLAAAPRAVTAPSGGAVVDAEARAAIAQLTAALRVVGVIADA